MTAGRQALGNLALGIFLSLPAFGAGIASVVQLDQGWDDAVRDEVHHLSFGSRIVPYDWLLHLEQAGNAEALRSDRHLAGLGFIAGSASHANPDALPIGFSRAVDGTGEAWAGLTCAACHTGALRYRSHELQIEGGAALIDYSGFEQALVDAIAATLADAHKFERFAQALAATDLDALRQRLQQRLGYLQQRRAYNASATPYGHGRLDAFGQIFNTVAVELLAIPDNARPADAPVSFPFLWDAPHLDLVQWNGSAPNTAPGPLIQNVTTALAVYGTADLQNHSGLTGYPSSVDLANLGSLQEHFYRLHAPSWPEALLGTLDENRRQRGQALYRDNCQSCHALSDRRDPDRKLRATLVPLSEIGTDETMARNYIDATAATGVLEDRRSLIFGGSRFGAEARTVDLVVHAAIGATLRHPLEAVRASLKDYHSVYDSQASQDPEFYKARPLAGVWATAPFLHNGSVPTLYDLLLPPDRRPVRFRVGGREFDPVRVGLQHGDGGGLFDTALPGNGNRGHVYGTDLGDVDRMALIEYLKSL